MKQVTAAVIGAGLRGNVYASYGLEHPEELKIVAVAEPDEERRIRFAQDYEIASGMCFSGYDELLSKERLADCVMICTQDQMHYDPVMKALQQGYHVLCEKPMSPYAADIFSMGCAAKKYGRILSICHVLRYSPFFSAIKQLVDDGAIGELICMQQIEEVGFWHHAHSFVRGNWRNDRLSSPMILQKCCHDMDILLWLADRECLSVQSFGELTHFRRENAPADAPSHCMDSCPHQDACAFYAPRFYLEHPRAEIDGLTHAVSVQTDRESLLSALQKGPYGRCVYQCDNTVVDHQIVNLQFAGGLTASFTMSAFTNECARKVNMMGTTGQIEGNMEEGTLTVYDFVSGKKERIDLQTPKKGHGGSDSLIIRDFVRQVADEDIAHGKTDAMVSVDSHLIALAAEESRLSGSIVDMRQYKEKLSRQ